MELHMEYYLVISTIMLFAGIYGFITRRNLLAVLISIELILNSVDINFAVFNRYLFPCLQNHTGTGHEHADSHFYLDGDFFHRH